MLTTCASQNVPTSVSQTVLPRQSLSVMHCCATLLPTIAFIYFWVAPCPATTLIIAPLHLSASQSPSHLHCYPLSHHTCCALHNNPPSQPSCATPLTTSLKKNTKTINSMLPNERGCNHVVNDVVASAFYWFSIFSFILIDFH